MITFSQILTILLSTGIPLFLWWLNKPKQKQETESIVVSSLKTALEEMRKEREDDRRQIEENRQEAMRAKAEARLAQDQNDDCEFEHGITRLQLNKVLRKLEMTNWIKSSVFVLDDNKLVIQTFEHRYKTYPVVAFKSFTDPDLCLAAAQKEKPEILVLDHYLSETRTAYDIIQQLGYEPEIFIMSGAKECEMIYKGTGVRFYYKDRFYIRNISKAIMEHLNEKNKHL